MAFLASSTESAAEAITPQPHPLDPLTAAEIEAATAAVKAAKGLAGTARFVYVSLYEPSKAEVIAYEAGAGATPPPPRLVKVVIRERAQRATYEAIVTLDAAAKAAAAHALAAGARRAALGDAGGVLRRRGPGPQRPPLASEPCASAASPTSTCA